MSNIPYYLIFSVTWLFSLLPFGVLYLISDILYFVIFNIAGYRKSTVYSNLSKAFPEKTDAETDMIARKFYRHFSDFLVEYVKGMTMRPGDYLKRFSIKSMEVIRELERTKTSFALVSAHYNNWEWGSCLQRAMEHQNLVIYRPLKSKAVDRLTKYIRNRHGLKMSPMDHIYREAINTRNRGELFMVWFLADQRPPRSNSFWTTFLNQETSFYQGAEKIARKLDLAVVFMDIQKKKRGYYEVAFKKLFDRGSLTGDNQITLACVQEMEKEIKERPEFWLWSHKRFKHSRPEGIKLTSR